MSAVERRRLGTEGLEVPAIGIGCMGMTGTYGDVDASEAIRTIHAALDAGVNFFDTAETYGPFANEELLGRALSGRRDEAIVATKFGFDFAPDGTRLGLNSQPEKVLSVIDQCLRRLRTDRVDILYQHRVDPHVPIEETVGAMARLVEQGKVRHLGLSEAGSTTLRRAHAVHPISVLQSEYSLWERAPETGVLPTTRELGIGFVAYAPLGRGFLAGIVKPADCYPDNDYRRLDPRLQGENFKHNTAIAERIKAIAERKSVLPAQLAIAWLLAQGPDIVAIPGTETRQYLRQNIDASHVVLDARDLEKIDAAVPRGVTRGRRWGPGWAEMLDEDQ